MDDFSFVKESNADEKLNGKTAKVNNACTDIPHNDNNEDIILQAILPVIVKQKETNKAVKTYAFYDNGSVGCFLTESLKNHLEAAGTNAAVRNYASSQPH